MSKTEVSTFSPTGPERQPAKALEPSPTVPRSDDLKSTPKSLKSVHVQ